VEADPQLVGLAVVPLQLVALVLRGLAFEYIGLAAAGAYLTLYRRMPHGAERRNAGLGLIETSVGAMAPAATTPVHPGATPSGSSGPGPAAA